VTEAVYYAGAALGVGFIKPIVTKYAGGYLPFGAYNGPIITAGSGWLTGKLFEMIPVNFVKKMAHPAMIVGLGAAIIELVNPYIRGVLGAAQAPLLSGPRRMVRGIGMTTGIPPRIVPLPAPAAAGPAVSGGMQGFGMRPGTYAFGR
jgi:hypothetical protein